METPGSVPVQFAARAHAKGRSETGVHLVRLQQCAAVEIGPQTYEELITVENNHKIRLSTLDTQVKIIYTLDGTEPLPGAKDTETYDSVAPFRLFLGRDPKIVRVRAWRKGWLKGPITEKSFVRPAATTTSLLNHDTTDANPIKGEFLQSGDEREVGKVTRRASLLMPMLSEHTFMLIAPEQGADTQALPSEVLIQTTDTKYNPKDLAAMTQQRRLQERDQRDAEARESVQREEQKRLKEENLMRATFEDPGLVFEVIFDELWEQAFVDIELWYEFLGKANTRYKKNNDGPYLDFVAPLGPLFQYNPKTRSGGPTNFKPLQGVSDPLPFEKTKAQVASEQQQQQAQLD